MTLPLGVTPDTAFDMRDPAHYPFQIGVIAQRIIGAWDGDHPMLKMNVAEWMDFYIRWCIENYPGCAENRVDEWQMDLLRPRFFIDRILSGVRSRMGGSPRYLSRPLPPGKWVRGDVAWRRTPARR